MPTKQQHTGLKVPAVHLFEHAMQSSADLHVTQLLPNAATQHCCAHLRHLRQCCHLQQQQQQRQQQHHHQQQQQPAHLQRQTQRASVSNALAWNKH
jgi:hypothetical protein